MSGETPKSGNNATETGSSRWTHLAAFVAGIVAVILFFVIFGIPSAFERYVHRHDEEWLERNSPTTTTTRPYVKPPFDKTCQEEFQAYLDEAVKELVVWAQSWLGTWELLSPEMQATYFGDGLNVSVWSRIDNLEQMAALTPDIFRGGSFDPVDLVVEFSRWPPERPIDWRDWHRVDREARALLAAMDYELNEITQSLLRATVGDDYKGSQLDKDYTLSWLLALPKITIPLGHAENCLDLAISSWHLATARAEEPWKYIDLPDQTADTSP